MRAARRPFETRRAVPRTLHQEYEALSRDEKRAAIGRLLRLSVHTIERKTLQEPRTTGTRPIAIHQTMVGKEAQLHYTRVEQEKNAEERMEQVYTSKCISR